MNAPRCFTREYDRITKVLSTKAYICPAVDHVKTDYAPEGKEYWGVWDTGSIKSVISQRVVDDLELNYVGCERVETDKGPITPPVFFISIILQGRIGILNIEVTAGNTQKADLLIGMDVIKQGDFAVTNINCRTVLSFRFPSIHCIDFTEKPF